MIYDHDMHKTYQQCGSIPAYSNTSGPWTHCLCMLGIELSDSENNSKTTDIRSTW